MTDNDTIFFLLPLAIMVSGAVYVLLKHHRRLRMICPWCMCLWDDHRTFGEWLASDDPMEVRQRLSADFNGPVVLCGDCADCSEPRP